MISTEDLSVLTSGKGTKLQRRNGFVTLNLKRQTLNMKAGYTLFSQIGGWIQLVYAYITSFISKSFLPVTSCH